MFRFHRDIVLGIFRGGTVGGGVDAEHGEVTGMTRPHPVVGIAAEFTDGTRGSHHEAHVLIHGVDEHVVLVAFVEGFHNHFVTTVSGILLFQFLDGLFHIFCAVGF